MKKILSLIFVCALFVSTTQAQLSVGFKGGLTMANLSFDADNHYSADYALGWHGAVFLKTGKGLFTFQPEVMFIQKGTRINSTTDATFSQLTMNYIDVPLLLRATIGIKVVEIYFNLGPYGGYWLGGKLKDYFYDDSQSQWVTNKETYDFDDDHDVRYDVGIVGGVGVKVLMIIFEVRYGHGFIDVFDYADDSNKETNRYFNFTLGVQL
ncbi:MAG: hypothetical protein DRJ15_13025 [Bacteroidetes bacterium]|nr:MAG: hypothetical protein DRI83_05195 [Bacteroidota bacterium]RLD77707.1 MAG: hypothetical protein DRJ15_13025 [Bacteroidota bacterium]